MTGEGSPERLAWLEWRRGAWGGDGVHKKTVQEKEGTAIEKLEKWRQTERKKGPEFCLVMPVGQLRQRGDFRSSIDRQPKKFEESSERGFVALVLEGVAAVPYDRSQFQPATKRKFSADQAKHPPSLQTGRLRLTDSQVARQCCFLTS